MLRQRVGNAAGVAAHPLGNRQHADIVDERGGAQRFNVAMIETHLFGNCDGEITHGFGVIGKFTAADAQRTMQAVERIAFVGRHDDLAIGRAAGRLHDGETAELRGEIFERDRLFDERRCPGAQRTRAQAPVAVRGEHQHGRKRMGRKRAHRLREGDAIHVGHEIVDDHERRAQVLQFVEGRVGVGERNGALSQYALDNSAVELEGRLIVVDDYDAVHVPSVPIFAAPRIIVAKTFSPDQVKQPSSGQAVVLGSTTKDVINGDSGQ